MSPGAAGPDALRLAAPYGTIRDNSDLSRFGSIGMTTEAQIRAGRALLGISQAALAELCGVSERTIKRVEAGMSARAGSVEAIRAALERRGVEFIAENGGGPGVRLRKRAKL